MSFDYHEPDSLEGAIGLLDAYRDEATLLAGGVSFMVLWRLGLARPEHVIGLRKLTMLREIRLDADGLWIGALVTHRTVERSTLVLGAHPMLAEAFAAIATVRIRNQGTVGGNLAHADPAQDPPPALIAVGATVVVAGPAGAVREVPVDSFFVGFLETVLAPNEIIVGVRVPPAEAGRRASFVKFLPRTADDYCTVSVAATARVVDGGVDCVRVALGGVASVPVRATHVESALLGKEPSPAAISVAAAAVLESIDPLDDHRGSAWYKRRMARVWVERVLHDVTRP